MSIKVISDLKSRAASFEAKHRIVPKAMGAATAIQLATITVAAEETVPSGSTSFDYSSILKSLQSGFIEIVNNCISLATAIIPVCVGMWGISLMIGWAKSSSIRQAKPLRHLMDCNAKGWVIVFTCP